MAQNAPKPYTNKTFADPSVNFYLAPNDTLVQCPYYPHKILQTKLAGHLSKCMTQYKKDAARNSRLPKFVICKDNWTHHIKEDEFEDHVNNHCTAARERMLREKENEYVVPAQETCSTTEAESTEELEDVDIDEISIGNSLEGPMCDDYPSRPASSMMSSLFDTRQVSSSMSFTDMDVEDRFKVNVAEGGRDPGTSAPPTRSLATFGKEDWDAEIYYARGSRGGPTYNAFDLDNVKPTYYMPPGMPPSERIVYRQKLAELKAEKMKEEEELEKATAEAEAVAAVEAAKARDEVPEGNSEDKNKTVGEEPDPFSDEAIAVADPRQVRFRSCQTLDPRLNKSSRHNLAPEEDVFHGGRTTTPASFDVNVFDYDGQKLPRRTGNR